MTLIEELFAQLQQVNGRAWLEELLIRGSDDGSIKGAHVVYGYAHPGIGGSEVRNTVGPWPLVIAENDPVWGPLMASINYTAIDQLGVYADSLTEQAQQILDLRSQVEQRQGQLDEMAKERDTLTAEREQLQQQLKEALANASGKNP